MWGGYDWNIFQITVAEILIQFILLRCVTNVFILTKFVLTIFSYFHKHWTWLRQISFVSFEFLITERISKFMLTWIFNIRRCFFGSSWNIFDCKLCFEIYSFYLHRLPCIFCMVMTNQLLHSSLMQYWQIFYSFLIFCYYFTCLKAPDLSFKIWETCKTFVILDMAPCDNL